MPITIWGLSLAQALLVTGNILLVSISSLIGQQLTDEPLLMTAPVAAQFIGLILSTMPAAHLMQKFGRKKGFVVGNVIGVCGALVAMQGLLMHSLAIFALGTFLTGMAIGTSQQYRFAALDECASPEMHSRAISLVMIGGVLAAFLGPNLAVWSRVWYAENPFVGAFFGLFAIYVIALILIIILPLKKHEHKVQQQSDQQPRSYSELLKQPVLLAALISGAIGYGLMVFLMTATPISMQKDGFEFSEIATVIQWHVLGMFVPSFFTGHLIRWAGARSIILLGCVLLISSALVGLLGISFVFYFVALMFLGIGWNFTFIGATSLLTLTYQPSEKGKVQGLNEFIVFSASAVGSFMAGPLIGMLGWSWSNLLSIPLSLIALVLILRIPLKAVQAR